MTTQLEVTIDQARRVAWLLVHGITDKVGIRIARRQDGTTYAALADRDRVYTMDETIDWIPFDGFGESIA